MLSRYLLKKPFGPGGILGFTSNESTLYPDLVANMVGLFLQFLVLSNCSVNSGRRIKFWLF